MAKRTESRLDLIQIFPLMLPGFSHLASFKIHAGSVISQSLIHLVNKYLLSTNNSERNKVCILESEGGIVDTVVC